MLILRMLSGLLAKAWGLLHWRRDGFVVSSPEFRPEPVRWIATTGCDQTTRTSSTSGDPYLDEARQIKKRHGAEWHAKAARKAVEALDGEGVLEHMRHFRGYSSDICGKRPAPPTGMSQCHKCGSTCAPADLWDWPAYYTALDEGPECAACIGPVFLCDKSWTSSDGRRTPVYEMTGGHLVNSARMVRRWLLAGTRPVSDDRIRMCGLVLQECESRGIMGEVRHG